MLFQVGFGQVTLSWVSTLGAGKGSCIRIGGGIQRKGTATLAYFANEVKELQKGGRAKET